MCGLLFLLASRLPSGGLSVPARLADGHPAPRMIKRNWPAFLVVALLLDLAYSFWQHLGASLSGDLAPIVLPSDAYRPVLYDPLGLHALRGEIYPAPNRYFQHQVILQYLRAVPLWLQRWATPIDSVYLACALAKTLIQAALIYLLGVCISGHTALTNRRWLLAAGLVTPLFQTNGWNGQLGIIDKSVVYAFCYAWSAVLLLVFFLPYVRSALRGQPLRHRSAWGWGQALVLAPVLALNSPIITGVAMIVAPGLLLYHGWGAYRAEAGKPWLERVQAAGRSLPLALWLPLVLLTLLSAYSLYIGRFNAENFVNVLPLADRYARLPLGVFYQFKQKLGWPLLLLMLGVNYWLLSRKPASPAQQRLWTLLRAVGLFAVVYILLLPLGGYRDYRPYILRRDTLLPVIIGVVWCYGASSYYLLRHLPAAAWGRYVGALGAFVLVCMLSDKPTNRENNLCERAALATLAAAQTDVVRLSADCTIMDWNVFHRPEQSAINAEMLHYWGITPKKTLYYQR